MRAAMQSRYGGPEVIDVCEIARPAPREDEILVRVAATTVTLADTAFRKADPVIIRLFGGLLRPKTTILGSTIAGVVEAVGSAVTRFKIGDAVYGSMSPDFGGAAEYVVLKANGAVVQAPEGVELASLAGLASGYLTAMPFIRDEGQVGPASKVLINGAAAGIGAVAVQLARHFGAEVTAVVSGRNGQMVRGLGADHVIDRTQADFTNAREAYDVIFDAVGKSSFARSREALKTGGIYLTTVMGFAIIWDMLTTRKSPKRARLATTGLRPEADKRRDLEALNELLAAGAVRPVIDRRFDLAEIVEAHRYVDSQSKAGDVLVMM
ncbi:MAG: NAD(P)-dependent alcohol dehydrogenase [Devosia sp.]